MRSRVNLIAILLTLGCLLPTLETKNAEEKREKENQRGYALSSIFPINTIIRGIPSKLLQENILAFGGDDPINRRKNTRKQQTRNNTALTKSAQLQRERPRRRKRKMDRMMMAMLMAYKMKFIALIPTLLGGLILLISTALLAGFFFALFAAVLGLKIH